MLKHLILTCSLCLILAPAAPSFGADVKAGGDAAAPQAPAEKKAPTKPYKKAAPKGANAELKTKQQRVGYAVGYNAAFGLKRNIEAQSVEVDIDSVKRGFSDAMSAAKSAIPEQDIRNILNDLQKDLEAKMKENAAKEQEKQRVQGEKNKQEGAAFLAENAKKEGVKTLPDGLQYRILSEGTGKRAAAEDTVTVQYRGTLTNGTEFDSSYKRNQPATFPLNQVIKGWTEGIPLIKEGGKIQLFIPADLAYGDRSMGAIGPFSTLIFEVELLSVQPASGPTPTGR